MNANQTASAINYEKMATEQAARRLRESPGQQAEAIAAHYVRYATLALQLSNLIYRGFTDADQTLIKWLLEEIKRGHKLDLGIPLEWPPNESK